MVRVRLRVRMAAERSFIVVNVASAGCGGGGWERSEACEVELMKELLSLYRFAEVLK